MRQERERIQAKDAVIQAEREKIKQAELRREELLKSRIHQSEVAALEKIRMQTVELVIQATQDVLKNSVKEKKIDETIDSSIKSLHKVI